MTLAAVVAKLRAAWRVVAGVAPTRRLAALVACAAPLWLLSARPWGLWFATIAAVALAVAAVVDGLLLPARADLEVLREMPASIGVGDRETLTYTIRSHWGRTLRVELFDELPVLVRRLGVLPAVNVAARGAVSIAADVDGRARGEAELGEVALRVRTTLGLVSRAFRYELPGIVTVAPSLAGVRRFRWLAVHQRLASAGVRDARRRGEGRAFSRLRDYVPGDDPRYMDWKATARRGHPITREFTIEQSQTVYLLVDAGRSMTQLAGEFARIEYALAAALVLADIAITAGDRVGAMVFDDRLRALVPAQRGLAALHALRTALVPVRASMVEPDYAAAFRALATRQRKRALLVLITDVLDARAARAMLAHFARGGSRHLAVVVALRNETLRAAAIAPDAAGTRGVYTAAAAAELLGERAVALQRMRDAGVIVLDVAPDAMAAALVGQYLELKARGAL